MARSDNYGPNRFIVSNKIFEDFKFVNFKVKNINLLFFLLFKFKNTNSLIVVAYAELRSMCLTGLSKAQIRDEIDITLEMIKESSTIEDAITVENVADDKCIKFNAAEQFRRRYLCVNKEFTYLCYDNVFYLMGKSEKILYMMCARFKNISCIYISMDNAHEMLGLDAGIRKGRIKADYIRKTISKLEAVGLINDVRIGKGVVDKIIKIEYTFNPKKTLTNDNNMPKRRILDF